MRKRVLISLVLLVAYSAGLIVFAFHTHQNTAQHVNCSICHVAGVSEKAVSQGLVQAQAVHVAFIQMESDSPIFRILITTSPERAPPFSAT